MEVGGCFQMLSKWNYSAFGSLFCFSSGSSSSTLRTFPQQSSLPSTMSAGVVIMPIRVIFTRSLMVSSSVSGIFVAKLCAMCTAADKHLDPCTVNSCGDNANLVLSSFFENTVNLNECHNNSPPFNLMYHDWISHIRSKGQSAYCSAYSLWTYLLVVSFSNAP